MSTIRDFKYKLIKNFFSKDELSLLQIHCKKFLKRPWVPEKSQGNSSLTPRWSNIEDHFMNVMHDHKLLKMEELTGLKLFKTYCYWRYYHFGSYLENHTDRPSCEISITACIHKTDDWPISMNGKEIEMEEGDGVIYLGCELEHGRSNKFKGDGMAQVFMHYVDQNGPYIDHKDDFISLSKQFGVVGANTIITDL